MALHRVPCFSSKIPVLSRLSFSKYLDELCLSAGYIQLIHISRKNNEAIFNEYYPPGKIAGLSADI